MLTARKRLIIGYALYDARCPFRRGDASQDKLTDKLCLHYEQVEAPRLASPRLTSPRRAALHRSRRAGVSKPPAVSRSGAGRSVSLRFSEFELPRSRPDSWKLRERRCAHVVVVPGPMMAEN